MLFPNFIQIPRMIVFPSRARLMIYMMYCKYTYNGTYVCVKCIYSYSLYSAFYEI